MKDMEYESDASADAAAQLAALGNPLRLRCFRYLMRFGPAGCPAGAIAEALRVAPSTLSPHLATLQQCGLLERRRERQRLLYAVRIDAVRTLVGFLVDECCAGHPELCELSPAALKPG